MAHHQNQAPVVVVDYGVGNIGAIQNMYDYLGFDAVLSGDPETVAQADRAILPGVGAFDEAMKRLTDSGLQAALDHLARDRQRPVLGICLGMQLLARSSEEGRLAGLGWIDAHVRKIPQRQPHIKVPHIGWSVVRPVRSSVLFPEQDDSERFYFVHSYHMDCQNADDILATIDYGTTLVAAVQKQNVFGAQFHPEKSHKFGMRLLTAFAELQL